MMKTSWLLIFRIPVLTYIHVTFTALKLLLIIILAIVYNKYTIPCLGALSEAFLGCWYFNYCHSDEVINLWHDSCALSKQNWSSFLHFLYRWTVQLVVRFEFFLTMKIHFVVSRLMTLLSPRGMCCYNCHPSHSILSWWQYVTLIHLPCHPDSKKS
jgi:hypothetical protein